MLQMKILAFVLFTILFVAACVGAFVVLCRGVLWLLDLCASHPLPRYCEEETNPDAWCLAELAKKGFAVTWMNGDVTYFVDPETGFNYEGYMRLSKDDREELNRLIRENESFHYKDMVDPYPEG